MPSVLGRAMVTRRRRTRMGGPLELVSYTTSMSTVVAVPATTRIGWVK
ncbi:MAG: hypothetical protein ACREMF_11265 [Gemmatimonadales bacterium]